MAKITLKKCPFYGAERKYYNEKTEHTAGVYRRDGC